MKAEILKIPLYRNDYLKKITDAENEIVFIYCKPAGFGTLQLALATVPNII